MVECKKRLNKILNKQLSRIEYSNHCLNYYIEMRYYQQENNANNKDWEKVYNISPFFFKYVRHSMIDSAFMEISKLYEKGNNSSNLYSLLNYVKGNSKNIVEKGYKKLNDIATSLLEELEKNENKAEEVKAIRDKVIAHNDKGYFIKEFKNDNINTFPYQDIKGLLKLAEKVVRQINDYVFDTPFKSIYDDEPFDRNHDIYKLMEFCLEKMDE